MKRINWISNLKAISCMMIFFHHILTVFLPGITYGSIRSDNIVGISSKIVETFAYQPWGGVINGNFAVCIFILLSSFLCFFKTYKSKKRIPDLIMHRYLRLMPAVFIGGLFYWLICFILKNINIVYDALITELSFKQFLYHALYLVWVELDVSIVSPLWCMYILFWSSFIAYFCGFICDEKNKYMPLYYLFISVFIVRWSIYYLATMFGVILADMYINNRGKQWFENSFIDKKQVRIIVVIVLMISGLILGGYPSESVEEKGFYNCIIGLKYSEIWHSIGAFCIVLSCMVWSSFADIKGVLLEYISTISYEIYIVHTMVINGISVYLYNVIFGVIMNGKLSLLLTIIVALFITIILARLLSELVKFSNVYLGKIYYVIKRTVHIKVRNNKLDNS